VCCTPDADIVDCRDLLLLQRARYEIDRGFGATPALVPNVMFQMAAFVKLLQRWTGVGM